jgi:hypothetical protein
MSWFKRIPHKYPPAIPAPAPYRSSPAVDRAREKAKESAPVFSNETVKKPPLNKE